MTQMARNAVDEESGYLRQHRYVLHDRDAKFCADFRKTLASAGFKCLRLPARSPNLNAFGEAMGALGEKRMSFAFHSVRGRLVAPRLEKLLRALSYRAQSPGEGERSVVPWWGASADES